MNKLITNIIYDNIDQNDITTLNYCNKDELYYALKLSVIVDNIIITTQILKYSIQPDNDIVEIAIKNNNVSLVNLLLKHVSDIDIKKIMLLRKTNNIICFIEIIIELINSNANVYEILYESCKLNYTDIIAIILNKYENIVANDDVALSYALCYKNDAIVQLLIKHKSIVTFNMIRYVIEQDYINSFLIMLENNVMNKDMALLLACEFRRVVMAKLLLHKGANINYTFFVNKLVSPLIISIDYRNKELIKLLLEYNVIIGNNIDIQMILLDIFLDEWYVMYNELIKCGVAKWVTYVYALLTKNSYMIYYYDSYCDSIDKTHAHEYLRLADERDREKLIDC